MRVKTFILATTALALSAGVAAAEPNGWYGAIDAGYHTIDDVEFVSNTTGRQFDYQVEDSWAGFARLGYRFTENWRVELEGGYRGNDIEAAFSPNAGIPNGICNVVPATGVCNGPDGDITAATLMANVIYDFGDASWDLRPFIGLGAGVARVNVDTLGTLGGNRTVGFGTDDSFTELAAQGILGLAWAISDRAHVDLTYRYLMSSYGEIDTFTSTAITDQGQFEGRYDDSHTLTLGLRYAFGPEPVVYVPPPLPPVVVTPPPPAPPAPRPPVVQTPQAREFVVYFDWDRSDLTAEAQSVVTQAANYAKSGRPTRVLVVGHADTSGSAAYNVGLSNRRSRTVADALVGQGVNGGVISLDGKGETALARATADGVREPLNRRATIDINF